MSTECLKENHKIDDLELINFINLNALESAHVLSMRNHDNIRQWLFSDHIISKQEHETFIDNLKKDNKNVYFLVKRNTEELGVISLNRLDIHNGNSYLGVYKNPEREIKGTGVLLMRGLIGLAFVKIGLHTLKLEVVDFNKKAIAFYSKMGFQHEGALKEFVHRNGAWHDVIVMGLINRNKGTSE